MKNAYFFVNFFILLLHNVSQCVIITIIFLLPLEGEMRVQVSKSKNAESFYIVESTYVNGKRSNKVVERLGTRKDLEDKLGPGVDVLQWAKDYAKELTDLKDAGQLGQANINFYLNQIIDKDSESSYHASYLFLQKIFSSLGLFDICKDISSKYKFDFDLGEILSHLVFARILYPCSKLSCYEFAMGFLEKPTYQLQHIYRALEVLAKESDFILANVYANSTSLVKRNNMVLFFDCTNYFFEIGLEDDFRKYGYSKEHRPNPIVQMAMFLDGNGLPLSFSLDAGNTNEQLMLRPLEKKILKDFNLSKFVVCTDAGLSSNANRKFNSFADRAFITTQSIKKLKSYLKDWALDPKGWYLMGGNGKKLYDISQIDEEKHRNSSFYKSRWINDNDLEQNLIISFSPKSKFYQRNVRERQIQRSIKVINQGEKKIETKGPNDVRRFIKRVSVTEDGELAQIKRYSIDENIIYEEEKYDGFYGICTNLEASCEQVIKISKQRWMIEEAFRAMKTEFKARPVYLQRKDRIQAHFLTCFLALLIYKILDEKLARKYTIEETLKELRKMDMVLIKDLYIPTYKRTEFTDALHELMDFRTDKEATPASEMRKIIKETKKRKNF